MVTLPPPAPYEVVDFNEPELLIGLDRPAPVLPLLPDFPCPPPPPPPASLPPPPFLRTRERSECLEKKGTNILCSNRVSRTNYCTITTDHSRGMTCDTNCSLYKSASATRPSIRRERQIKKLCFFVCGKSPNFSKITGSECGVKS